MPLRVVEPSPSLPRSPSLSNDSGSEETRPSIDLPSPVDFRALSTEQLLGYERADAFVARGEQLGAAHGADPFREHRDRIQAATAELNRRQRTNMVQTLGVVVGNVAVMSATAASVIALCPPVGTAAAFGCSLGLGIIDYVVLAHVTNKEAPSCRRVPSFWLHVVRGASLGAAALAIASPTLVITAAMTVAMAALFLLAAVLAPRWTLHKGERQIEMLTLASAGLHLLELVVGRYARVPVSLSSFGTMLGLLVGIAAIPPAVDSYVQEARGAEFNPYACAASLTSSFSGAFLGMSYGLNPWTKSYEGPLLFHRYRRTQ